ncbi:MAG: ABC transporter substrate-binding protein [Deltaproteobacteria bacterium]|nr:ABC transporter substrate-binding protein [Deltaproteobacteria bacterium]
MFGAILPLTGSASRPAQSAWQWLLYASGRPCRAPARPDAPIVLFRDDRGDPDRAAQAVEELTVRHRAIAIIGPMDFECVRKAGEVAARLRIPLVSLTQADPELPPNVFPLLPSIEEEVEVLLESAIAQGATRFALIHSGNFESEQARQAFEETLKRHRLYGNARSLLVSQALKSFESLLRTPPEAVLFAPQEPRHSQDLFLTFIHRAEKARAASRSRSQPGWTWLFPSAFEPAQEPLLHLPSIRLVFDIPQFRSMPGAEARRSTDPEIQKAFESQFHRPLQGPAAQAFDAFEILRALVDAGARTRPALFESLSALTKNDGPFPRALLRVRAARN